MHKPHSQLRAAHLIKNGIVNFELNDAALDVPKEDAHKHDEVEKIRKVLDEFVHPNFFLKMLDIYQR